MIISSEWNQGQQQQTAKWEFLQRKQNYNIPIRKLSMRKKSMMISEQETAGGHNKLRTNGNKNFHEYINLREQKLRNKCYGTDKFSLYLNHCLSKQNISKFSVFYKIDIIFYTKESYSYIC